MKEILPCCNINLPVRMRWAFYNDDLRENGLLSNNLSNKTLNNKQVWTQYPFFFFFLSACYELRTQPKQCCGFHTAGTALSEGYFFKQRVSVHETGFYRTMTHRKDGWEKPSKQGGVVWVFVFSLCKACSSKFSHSNPSIQVQFSHKGPDAKTNKDLSGIWTSWWWYFGHSRGSVLPLRQGWVERQTQRRWRGETLLSQSCKMLSQIYTYCLVINPQIHHHYYCGVQM